MNKTTKQLLALVSILVIPSLLFSGCCFSSGSEKTPSGNVDTIPDSTPVDTPVDTNPLTGTDVFNGDRFNEMIWGYYEADCYTYTGSNSDADEFLNGMEYITLSAEGQEVEFAAMPLTMQAGKYSHLMNSFFFEDDYYEPYTEKGKAMFRKAYIAEVGDMNEEEFKRIETLMDLDVIQLTISYRSGSTFYATLAYEVHNDRLALYDLLVDEDDYTITISDEPILEYHFLHDGGKLTLEYNGVERHYQTNGYKAEDSSLAISGYALNDQNRYGDLEGFSLYYYTDSNKLSVYPDLTNNDSPIDPIMDLNTDTGEFTLSWQERWKTDATGYINRVADPCTISGKIVPVTSYGFTSYSGFFLFVDGKRYDYLMSEKEYDERRYGDVLGDDVSIEDISDSQLEAIETTKRNILEDLQAAFKEKGIDADIDYVSGKISLEASFLFDVNSSEISKEGQAYLNKFADVYTSVVLGDEYIEYIARIAIEGHTDTSGSYSLNQELSEARATAVANHCIAQSPALKSMIQTKGCSYDYPVYNDDGTVNMEKSRRVTFRFVFADL